MSLLKLHYVGLEIITIFTKNFQILNATNNEQDTLYTTEIDNDVQTCNFEKPELNTLHCLYKKSV